MARVTVGQFKNRGQMVRNQRKKDEEEKKTSNRSNNKPKNNSNRNSKDNDNARDSLSVPKAAVRIAGREVKEGYQGAAVKYNNLIAGDGVNVGRGTLGAHQHNGLIRQKGTNDRRTGTELKRNEQINQKFEKTQNNIKDFSKKAGKQDEKAVAKSQKETEKIRENTTKDMSGFGKWAFNTAVAGMEMLPDLAIGALIPEVAIGKRLMGAGKLGRKAATKIDNAATSFLKTTPMGMRAGGSDYIQQKRDGKTEAQAQVHGTGTGIIEQITEMLGGNLGLSKALGKGIVGTGAKTLKGRVAKNAFEEGMEEVAADYLSPILDRITGDKDALGQYKTSDFHMQALQDFASGAVLSTVLGAPGVIKSGVKARNLTEEDNERILKKGLAQSEDSDAFQYAKNIMDRKANGESISSNEMYNLAGVVSGEEAINGIKYSGIYNKVKENRASDVEQLRSIEKSFNSQEIDVANEYTDKLINDVKSNFKDVNDTLANSMARVAVGAGTLSDAIEVSEASLEDRQKFMQFTGVQLPIDNNAAFRSAVVEMTYNNNIDYGLKQRDIVESEVDRINGGKFVFSKENTEIQNPHLVNAHDSKIMRDYVAKLSDSEADSYIAGYESGDVAAYTKAYDAYRRAGRSGVEFTNAREINSAHVINPSVARNAWSTGRKVRAEEKVKKQKREENRKAEYEKHKNSPLYGKLDRMSDEDRVTLNAILSQKGLTAEIVEDIEDVNGNKRSISSANANSFIDLANGKITIKESVNAIQALLHEIWHYENAVNPKDVNKANKAMKDFYIQKFGKKAWDRLVKEKAGAYNGILEDTKEFEEEIYCDMIAGIFSTKKGVNQFADWLTNESNYTTAEQKTILQQLLDIVNKVANAVSNLVNDKKALSGTTSEMREVFRKSERNANELRKQILDILNNNVNTSEIEGNDDIRYSIAGKKAHTANYEKLKEAKVMEAKGSDMESIRQATKWFKGDDGIWRFEISNKDFKLVNKSIMEQCPIFTNKSSWSVLENSWTLKDIVVNDGGLFEAYPWLADVHVIRKRMNKAAAWAAEYSNKNTGEILSTIVFSSKGMSKDTILHEIQHIIQDWEGFASGGNTGMFNSEAGKLARKQKKENEQIIKKLQTRHNELIDTIERTIKPLVASGSKTYQDLEAQISKLENYKNKGTISALEAYDRIHELEGLQWNEMIRYCEEESDPKYVDILKEYKANLTQFNKLGYTTEGDIKHKIAYDMYRDIIGEAEAFNVESRADMSEEELMANPPDIQRERIIYAEDYTGKARPTPDPIIQLTEDDLYDQAKLKETENGQMAFNFGDIKFSLAEQQLDIINTYNPMRDDYHTGIRSTDDIHTLEEALQDSEYENWREDGFPYPDITPDLIQNALDSGHITVYSSYPIDQGVFVTPSKVMADEYAGNIPGRPAQTPVYSKTVNLDEVAWITPEEGQYANINIEASADNNLYKNGYTAQDLLGEPDVKFSFGEAGTFFGAHARQGKTSMDVVKGKVKARGPKGGIQNSVLESGESVLRRVMMENIKKNQGKDFVKEDAEKEIENVVSFMREMNDMFSEFGKQYTFVNFDEIKNASIDVRRNHDGTCSVTMTSMIKNGEYPINFDFTTICKKRGPLMQVIEGLTKVSEKGKSLALTPEQILDINNALRKEGVETACLGCFVEARRYHMVSYTDKVCNLWNSLVDEYAKQHGIKVEDIEDFNFSRGENATEENFQAAADTFFNYTNDKSGKGNPTDRFKLIIKHGGDTYLKHLRPADLVTPNGLKGIKSLSTNEKDLFGMLKSAYGTAAPKETVKYVPYNSEIALLPKTKDKKPFVKYLESIGGIRTQSFSDFLIQNTFDYMQMVADMAARGFPAHAYTKELAFAKIFGQTGIKINMSVMFDVWNGKQWADAIGCSEKRGNELARKYAGLQFFKNEDEIPDSFRDDNGNVRRNHIREVDIDGTHGYITYLVGDQARSDRVWQQTYEDAISAGKAPEIAEEIANEGRKWVQSIDLKEAVTLENTEGYADNVGIIGVGTSDEVISLMLDDKDFPFIIPYHASGMPEVVKRLTNLMFATNYESTQNARILSTIIDENGNDLGTNYPNELFEKLGDWRAVWSEINNSIANGWKVEGRGPKKNSEGKVIEKDANGNPYELHGVGGYDIYSDLKNGYSPREMASRYLEDCGKNGLLPVFYQFAGHENYYKLLVDYSVTNLVSGETAPQGAVKNQYPGYNANTGEGDISELKKICEEEAAARNADMEKQNRVANDLVNKKAIEFGLVDENESDVKFSMDETNARYVEESRGRRNSTLSAAKRNASSITNSIYEQTKKYTDTDIIRSNVKDIISPYLEGINRNERSNRVDTVMWAVQKAALDIRNNDIDAAWETLFDASTYIVDNATMIDDSAYVEYEMLRQYLRKTAIKVPKHVQGDIPDYGEYRKRNMGRIKFKNDGANIDSVYIELNEQFPELFPKDIVNQADQLMRMSDVWDKIKPMPISFSDAEVGEISMNITNILIDYAASDGIFKKVKQYNQPTDGAIDYLKEHAKANRINLNDILEAAGVKSIKQMSKEQYMEAVRTIDEVAKIRKQIKEQNADNADIGFGPFNGTQEEIKEVLDEIRTKIRNEVDKARGDATTEDIGFGKFEGDQDAFIEMQAEIERRRTHRAIQQQHVEDIKQAFKDEGYDFDEVLSNAKNKSTISSNDNTPQRFFEKSLGFKEGKLLSKLIIENSGKSEAEGIKWLNGMRDLIKSVAKEYKIKAGSKEDAAAQMYGEGFYVNEVGDFVEYGDAELAADFPDKTVQERIKGLAKDQRIRQAYDETLSLINDVYTRNGYETIGRLDNYFLHFMMPNDILTKIGFPFNPFDMKSKDLPTNLNGITADLKPGRPYFSSNMHRKGNKTTYSVLMGFERYMESAKNQIYHIDDIQRLRGLRTYLAETFGQEHGLDNIENMSEEEINVRIDEMYNKRHLSTFAAFLNEQANILAGKTSLIDRGVEGKIGRRGLTIMSAISAQVSSNMVGANISSSLTNFISLTQAFSTTSKVDFLKAIVDYTIGIFNKDTFVEDNDFLVRRLMDKGATFKTSWAKITDAGFIFMSATDKICAEVITRAKFNEFKRKGLSDSEAHDEAGRAAARILGDRSLGMMPHLYNARSLSFLTKFQLEVRNQLDVMTWDIFQNANADVADIENALKRNSKKAAKITSQVFQLIIVQNIFGGIFKELFGYNPCFDIISLILTALGFGFDDDDDFNPVDFTKIKKNNNTVQDNLTDSFEELLSMLPYASVLSGGRIPLANALPISELAKGKDQFGNKKSRLETIIGALPYYVMPTGYSQLKKTFNGLMMFREGQAEGYGSYTKSGNLRFSLEKTPFNVIQAGVAGQWASNAAQEYINSLDAPSANEALKGTKGNVTEYNGETYRKSADGKWTKDTTGRYLSEDSVDFYNAKSKAQKKAEAENATEEEILQSKYLNSMGYQIAELQKEYKETDGDKSGLESEIDRLSNEAIDGYKNVSAGSTTATVNGVEFYKDDEGKWHKKRESTSTASKSKTSSITKSSKKSPGKSMSRKRSGGHISASAPSPKSIGSHTVGSYTGGRGIKKNSGVSVATNTVKPAKLSTNNTASVNKTGKLSKTKRVTVAAASKNYGKKKSVSKKKSGVTVADIKKSFNKSFGA